MPVKRFVLATWSGTVGPDIHVKAGHTLYSVPWRYIGRPGRSTAAMVQIFDDGQLIATHPFQASGKRTAIAHYPPERIAFHMRTPTWCRQRATEFGQACVAVIGELLAVNALFRLRAAQGVLGLASKYGAGRLELACAKAIAAGDPTYRTIKGVLAAGLEADPVPPRPATAGGGVPARPVAAVRERGGHAHPEHRHHQRRSRRLRRAASGGVSMIVDTALEQALRTLKLSGMLHTLEARLAQACAGELGHIEFLQVLCHDEIARRESEAINRRIRRAQFEQQATLEGFNFATKPKLPAAQIRDLAALRWLAAGESVVLYAVTCLHGPRVLSLLFSRQVTVLAISGTPNGPSYADLVAVIDDVAHCPGLHPVGQSPPVAGLEELAETRARPPT